MSHPHAAAGVVTDSFVTAAPLQLSGRAYCPSTRTHATCRAEQSSRASTPTCRPAHAPGCCCCANAQAVLCEVHIWQVCDCQQALAGRGGLVQHAQALRIAVRGPAGVVGVLVRGAAHQRRPAGNARTRNSQYAALSTCMQYVVRHTHCTQAGPVQAGQWGSRNAQVGVCPGLFGVGFATSTVQLAAGALD